MGKVKEPRESDIEKMLLNYLNMDPRFFVWKTHTTGVFDTRQKVFRPLQGFAIKGVSDIIGVKAPSGRVVAIEAKTPKGKKDHFRYLQPEYSPTSGTLKKVRHAQEQRAFLQRIFSFGGLAGVAASIEDLIDILEGRGKF